MTKDKEIESAILNDVQQDLERLLNKIRTELGTNAWSDDSRVQYARIDEWLYSIKVVEQRLRYLASINY